MELVKASASLMIGTQDISPGSQLRVLEWIGRHAWKSEDKITEDSAPRFIGMILEKQHESVIEHVSATVKFVVDRGVSHEIVRHRIASYTQESTRYCNYKRKGVVFIEPPFAAEEHRSLWLKAMGVAEAIYLQMIDAGVKPQIARSVLPNSLKTELIMTANLRSWRNFFKLRTAPGAHPQIREVAVPLLADFKQVYPVVFDDINPA